MAILKEYICKAHGAFEGFDPACPHGCKGTMVEREFRSAPAVHYKDGFNQSSNIDKNLNNLAKDYGMTDIKHNSMGSVAGSLPPDLSPRWGSGGLAGLQKEGHQLGQSGLNVVQNTLRKPEATIPAHVKAQSAKDLVT